MTRRLLLLLIPIVIMLLAAFSLFGYSYFYKDSRNKKELNAGNEKYVSTTQELSTIPTSVIEQSNSEIPFTSESTLPLDTADEPANNIEEDTVVFTLYASRYISDDDYDKSVLVIKERVEAMTDEYEFAPNNENHTITITMLRSVLGANSVLIEKTISIIAGAGSFMLFYRKADVELDENVIIEAEVRNGKIDFVIPDPFLSLDDWKLLRESDTSDMNYIHVKVNQNCAESIHEVVKDGYSGSNYAEILANYRIINSVLIDYIEVGLYSPDPDADDEFNIIMLDVKRASISKLIATTLKQSSIIQPFHFSVHEKVIYEKTDNQTKGELQHDSITGNVVRLLYKIEESNFKFFEESDYSRIVTILKHRMDAIGNPYAIGYPSFHENMIAIVTTPDKLGHDLAVLIGANGAIKLVSSDKNTVFYDWDIALTKNQISDVYYSINIQFEQEKANIKKAESLIGKTLYLSIDDTVICKTNVTAEDVSNGLFIFTEFVFSSHTEMSNKNKFILDLLLEIVNGERLHYSTFEVHRYGKDEKWHRVSLVLNTVSWKDEIENWGINTDSDEYMRIDRIIDEQFKNIHVYKPNSGRLNILIDLKADDSMPQRFLELVTAVYNKCDFDNKDYEVYFVCETAEKPDDRFRVWFKRIHDYSWEEDKTNVGKMGYGYLIYGETLGKYKDEMEALFRTAPLFKDRPKCD